MMSTEIHFGIVAATRMVTKNLTDEELNALYMVSLLGANPKGVIGYEKAKPLFTEQDETKMHHDVKVVFGAIWQERLGEQ